MLSVIFICQCEKEPNPDRYLNYPYFEIIDTTFFHLLIMQGIDTDGDSLISYEEAEAVTYLNVGNTKFDMSPVYDIYDMTGIEAFINLEYLNCSQQQMESLDLSKNKLLRVLIVDGRENHYGKNHKGQYPLKNLNVTNCHLLQTLICCHNHLTELDLSTNYSLRKLNCRFNDLTYLNISNCLCLSYLECWWNELTSLNISNNTELDTLVCGANDFVTALDISQNTDLVFINIGGMQSLTQVCVWTIPFPPQGVEIYNEPNVYFTTDCSK